MSQSDAQHDPSSLGPGQRNPGDLHVPVMLEAILDHLGVVFQARQDAAESAIHVDGTLGMGGHGEAVLDRFGNVRLVGIDRDPVARELAGRRLAHFGDRVEVVGAVFSELDAVLDELDIDGIDTMLLDLGLSSLQIDDRERGFAYSVDAPLDMRMGDMRMGDMRMGTGADDEAGTTAADLLNTLPASELEHILKVYGEEPFARRIAQQVVARRQHEPFVRSAQLVAALDAAIPAAVRARSGHPAKRTFQALRIAVNQELAALESVLPQALERLRPGGRLAVLSYHSLEDRMVKQAFRRASSDDVPPGLPVVPDHLRARFTEVTRGAQKPDATEIASNPRSASARLRVIQRREDAR